MLEVRKKKKRVVVVDTLEPAVWWKTPRNQDELSKIRDHQLLDTVRLFVSIFFPLFSLHLFDSGSRGVVGQWIIRNVVVVVVVFVYEDMVVEVLCNFHRFPRALLGSIWNTPTLHSYGDLFIKNSLRRSKLGAVSLWVRIFQVAILIILPVDW